jgi:hypothetical protein
MAFRLTSFDIGANGTIVAGLSGACALIATHSITTALSGTE